MKTWPSDWEERRRGIGCAACEGGRPDTIPNADRFYSGPTADAYLHRSSSAPGYSIVTWRGRHAAEPTELTADEWCSFSGEVRLVCQAIEAVYAPAKLNIMLLGNSLPHLHAHIVPRYLGDPDPGRPPLFLMGPEAGSDLEDQKGRLRTLAAAIAEVAT